MFVSVPVAVAVLVADTLGEAVTVAPALTVCVVEDEGEDAGEGLTLPVAEHDGVAVTVTDHDTLAV